MQTASLKRLRLSKFKLETLLNVTNAINSNISKSELFEYFGRILHKQLNIGEVIVLCNENNKLTCELQIGIKTDYFDNENLMPVFNKYKNITSIIQEKNKIINRFDFVIPIWHKNLPLGFILIGDIEEGQGMSPTIRHLNFVQTLANVVMVAVENKKLFNKLINQQGVKKELELAAKMQSLLIPKSENLPKTDKIKIAAYYKPYYEVGGDYYDIIKLNNNEYGFCIADVSGKGVSAALLMSNFQANIRALFTSENNLKDIVLKLNNRIIEITNSDKFITLFIGKINIKTNKLKYINCGHLPPILYNKYTKEIHFLKKGTIGIGMLRKMPYFTTSCYKIKHNSRIICVTDGITETENNKQKYFGTKRIIAELKKDITIENVIENTIEKVKKFRKNKPQFDDITILGIDVSF